MDPSQAIELARQTLLAALLLTAPLLGIALFVALTLSILQTVFNLQEQTLTVVPKIVTVILATLALSPWLLRTLVDFTVRLMRDTLPMRS